MGEEKSDNDSSIERQLDRQAEAKIRGERNRKRDIDADCVMVIVRVFVSESVFFV